jgi:integrase
MGSDWVLEHSSGCEFCEESRCQSHSFRRTFACLLLKAGVDAMTVKDLGGWESLEMVQRYTSSVTFEDSLKFYKAPLS